MVAVKREREGEGGRGREKRGEWRGGTENNLLQDISIEAEVEPHTLSPTLLVGGGQGAKSRVIRLSWSIPRGDLGDKDIHQLSFALHRDRHTFSPVKGFFTEVLSKLKVPVSSCVLDINTTSIQHSHTL